MARTGIPTDDYNEYMRLYMLERRHRHRADGLARLGGVCGGCGSPDVDEFDFHHIDPATKAFNIGTHLHLGWDRLVAEIDKCELRCKACHRDEHRSTAPCGTAQRYWRGCRCDPCTKALREHELIAQRARRGSTPRPPRGVIAHGTRAGYLKVTDSGAVAMPSEVFADLLRRASEQAEMESMGL